jgi:spermidine synthase
MTAMFLTGFSGLLYQILWIRTFSSILGGTTLSISCVIAHFMLGLGLGTAWAPRLLQLRSKKNLPLYSYCEFVIVLVIAIGFSILLGYPEFLSAWLRDFSGPQLISHFLLTGVFVFPATFMMGLSFPVLSYKFSDPREHQWLYAANCLGGAIGALLSYTVLVYHYGLSETLYFGFILNLCAGLVFIRHKFQFSHSVAADDESKEAIAQIEGVSSRAVGLWALCLSGLSGFFVLSLEQMWFRLAHLFLGGRIYVHSLVLAALLISLAIGAFLSPKLSKLKFTEQIPRMIYILLFAAISVAIGFMFFPQAIAYSVDLAHPYHKTIHTVFFVTFIFIAVIPGILLGLCFPLSLKVIQTGMSTALGRTRSLSKAIYINTFASVLGSLLATYVFFPVLGTVGSLKVLIGSLVVLALVGTWVFMPGRRKWEVLLAGVGILIFIVIKPLSLNPAASSLFEAEDEFGYLAVLPLIEENPQSQMQRWAMFHNYSSLVAPYGYGETSVVQNNLALFPAAFAKSLDDVLVVGMGYGLTGEAFVKIPEAKEITSVEILPLVIKAQDRLTFKNNDYLKDPRVHNIAADGRSYVALSNKKWDVLTVNVDPYGTGTTHLMSDEFYKIARQHLKPGGVYAQLLFGSKTALQALIYTAKTNFPYYKIMPGYNYDGVIFLGKNEPFGEWKDASWSRVANLLPSRSWEPDELKSAEDFVTAEKMANAWLEFIRRDVGEYDDLVTDDNLLVEKSRTGPLDLFLHYPKDY